MEIKYVGDTFTIVKLQVLLSIGYPVARDIIDNLLVKGDIIKVGEREYIFKEQVIVN